MGLGLNKMKICKECGMEIEEAKDENVCIVVHYVCGECGDSFDDYYEADDCYKSHREEE